MPDGRQWRAEGRQPPFIFLRRERAQTKERAQIEEREEKKKR
jgi:hypothetical protein